MVEETRKTGIDAIGDAHWGTHFCQFYETRGDLIDVLVPFFKAGLESNEFCMWVTSDPLGVEEAEKAMSRAVADFDRYLLQEQMEIVPYTGWYLEDGVFNLQRILNSWISKLDEALVKGYEGLRITGNTAWLERKDWEAFADYEKEVDRVIGKYKMIALCTYRLDRCGVSEVLDVVRNHRFALIRRRGEWQLIESTERKQMEEEISRQANLTQKTFDGLTDAVFVLDANAPPVIVDCNESACTVFGYGKAEMIGKTTAFLHVNDETLKEFQSKLYPAAEKEDLPFHLLDFRMRRRDGSIFASEHSVTQLMNEKGERIGWVSIVRDIAERKKDEQALKDSEEKYRKLFEEAIDAIFVADAETGITIDCNREASRLVGREKEELVGKHQRILHPPEEIEGRFSRTFRQHLEEKEGEVLEAQVVTKTGERRDVAIKGNTLELRDRKVIQGIFRDITEQKKAEDELIRLSNAVKMSTDSIVIGDLDARIIDVNEATLKMYGTDDKEDLIGKDSFSLIAPEDRERALAGMKEALEKGHTTSREYAIMTKSGGRIPVEMSAALMKDADGKPVGFVGISRDITERKRMEEELKRYSVRLEEKVEERTRRLKEAQERLVKAERLAAIGETAAMVGHDLRNPLQVIVNTLYMGRKKLIELGYPERQEVEELCETIKQQTEYMDKIVSDLQEYARPIKPRYVPTTLRQLINDAFSTVSVPKNVEILVQVEDGLKIVADPQLLKRAFANIVTNALQAMPEGGKLTIKASRTEEETSVSFEDSGIGIPEENLPKLFHPLFTTKAKGQGFGLPVCKRIVEAHNGRITVRSRVGEGSTFTVRIPLRRQSPEYVVNV